MCLKYLKLVFHRFPFWCSRRMPSLEMRSTLTGFHLLSNLSKFLLQASGSDLYLKLMLPSRKWVQLLQFPSPRKWAQLLLQSEILVSSLLCVSDQRPTHLGLLVPFSVIGCSSIITYFDIYPVIHLYIPFVYPYTCSTLAQTTSINIDCSP